MGISFNAASLLNGNGIDVNAVIKEMQAVSSGQLTLWQQEQSSLQTNASLLTTINNDLSNLSSAVNALSDPLGALTAVSATSSLPAVLTATADPTATAGTHSIVLSGLASAGTVYTQALANANTSILPSGAASGDLKLQAGGSSGTTYDIPITQGSNDTISTLASYINRQSTAHNWGVTATVLNDASGARLAIYSQATGTPGALAITANATFDSNSNNTGNPTNLTFLAPVGGTNASFTVDGIPFSSTTNTVKDAIPGVTVNLASVYSGQVQVTVGSDTTQINGAVSNFVSAYNTLINDINKQFAVDPTTNNQGPLGTDASLRSLQSSLMTDVTYAMSGNSGLVNLASLGINMNNDGTLSIDAKQFSSSLAANPAAVTNFFQNAGATGFANNFGKDLMNLTDPTQGPLSLDLTQNRSEQTDLTNQITDFQAQLAQQQQALQAQFSQVNATLEMYPFLLQSVLSQLGWTMSSSNSSNTSPATGSSTSNSSGG
jgi:flagellar hook-associated protein 2